MAAILASKGLQDSDDRFDHAILSVQSWHDINVGRQVYQAVLEAPTEDDLRLVAVYPQVPSTFRDRVLTVYNNVLRGDSLAVAESKLRREDDLEAQFFTDGRSLDEYLN